MNNTSVKIEANYLKKRYDEEQQKLQQLEKDHQLSEARFKKQQAELQEELDAIDEEVESRRKKLETIMTAEGKTYSNKIYGLINDIVNKQNEPHMKEMEDQKVAMEEEIENMKSKISSCELELNTKAEKINELERELGQKLAEIETIDNIKEYFSSPEFRLRIQSSNMSPEEYKDMISTQELQTKLARVEEQLAMANEKNTKLEEQNAKLTQSINAAKAMSAPIAKPKEEPKPDKAKMEELDFDKASKKMMEEVDSEAKKEVKKVPVTDKPKTAGSAENVSSLNSKKNNLMSSIQKLNSIKKKQ